MIQHVLARIPALAAGHVAIAAASLAVAFVIALPLGVAASGRPRLSAWLLGGLGALYTVPSLALLAVLVRLFGLGFVPLFVALIAYAQFMLARGVVSGLRAVDPAQIDAATGLGMSPKQVLRRVALPQAVPAIVGGVRVAAIAVISIATLGGYVGAGGLGVLIFEGLTLHNTASIVAGSICVCALAVVADALLRLLERRVSAT
jgi:osmoprotectant transport system permease protein